LLDIIEATGTARNRDELGTAERQKARGENAQRQFRDIVHELRSLWPSVFGAKRHLRIALAVLHGLAEWSINLRVDEQHLSYFRRQLALFREGAANPMAIENEAAPFGFSVCLCTDSVLETTAWFGYVEEIENIDGVPTARVILHDQDDREVEIDETVSCAWLPQAYREEGAGVAWVERRYASGPFGRFEPASVGPER
jgi:hypothetical protein